MLYRILALLTSFTLFAQTTTTSAVGALSGVNAIFPIDSSVRGLEIINLFKTLYGMSVPSGAVYEIGIQTKYNGFLQWVQSVTGTTNNTLLIIQNGTTKANAVLNSTPPVIIPADQVVEMVFSTNSVTIPNATFGASNTTGFLSGTLPIYSVSPALRAADILFVFKYFQSTISPNSQFKYMTIQTSLTGLTPPYQNPKSTTFNGTLSYVQNVTLTPTVTAPGATAGPFLQITYQPNKTPPLITLDVAPEQVCGISFSQN